jgi:hypothetical protein
MKAAENEVGAARADLAVAPKAAMEAACLPGTSFAVQTAAEPGQLSDGPADAVWACARPIRFALASAGRRLALSRAIAHRDFTGAASPTRRKLAP